MARTDFLAAAAKYAAQFAPQYGLDPRELQYMIVTAAGLEGGLGDRPSVGDGGASHGRFQFNTNGGVGATLLGQGWTHDDFYNDDKVTAYWAPVLAQHLVAAKQKGFTGGEAIRQGIYSAERPAVIYDSKRFNQVSSEASSLIGGAPPSATASSGGGRMPVESGYDWDGEEAKYKAAADEALARFRANPTDQTAYEEWKAAVDSLESFRQDRRAFQSDVYRSQGDPAQQAFDNAITLGDYQSKQADRLYSRWLSANERAQDATVDQIKSAHDDIESERASEAKFFGTDVRSGKPTVTIVPRFEDSLKMWQKRYGAEGGPPPATSDALPPGWDSGAAGAAGNQTYQASGAFPLNEAAGQIDVAPSYQGPDPSTYTVGQADQVYDRSGAARGYQPDQARAAGAASTASRVTDTINGFWSGGGDRGSLIDQWSTRRGSDGNSRRAKWWQTLGAGERGAYGVPFYATGTSNHPGGPAIVNEKGPETIVTPDGQAGQLPGGPQMAMLPEGSMVIPPGIPPEEAQIYQQIMAAMQGGGGAPNSSPEAQAARANDPQLQQKVMESLRRAMGASWATKPPMTPVLTGQWSSDPWADRRALTGIPAQPMPAEVA